MSKFALKTDALKDALKTYDKKVNLDLKEGKSTAIPFVDSNKELLKFLYESMSLTAAQKSKINSYLFASENLGAEVVGSVNELYNRIEFISESTEPVLEVKLNNKWYPILGTVSKFKTFTGSWIMDLSVYGHLGGLNYTRNVYLGDWSFEDRSGKPVKKTVNEMLEKDGFRIASTESIAHAKSLQPRLLELSTLTDKAFDAHGTALVYQNYWGWAETNIAWKESPVVVILEPTLENQYAVHNNLQQDGWRLPFVRVFSLKHKSYMFVDVEDMVEHKYHRDGKNKIVLPPRMFNALDSIFNAQQGQIFGDLFHGRHGGIVVLANGPSGVGKTLTAEVFAEFQERPLYSMEMSEIGTTLASVEANLQKIFARAKKWNAVLLFDEADIFLSERVASDLERSAIVGIFLRLLDYYEGTFFLTTNRGEGIDKAFKSRVTLYLNYPDLSPQTRKTIWQNMLEAASLKVTEDHVTWNDIAEVKLNGRQIRNQVRLLKLMYPEGNVTSSEVSESLDFTAR